MNNRLNVDNENYIVCSNSSSTESDINNNNANKETEEANLPLSNNKNNYFFNDEINELKSKLIIKEESNLNRSKQDDILLNNNNNSSNIRQDANNSKIWITNQDLNVSDIDKEQEEVAKKLPEKRYLTNEGIINVKTIKNKTLL